MTSIEVQAISYNEEAMLPYWIRHFSTFASKLVLHDSGSTDRTVEIAKAAGVEIRPWSMDNKVNDRLMAEKKAEGWKGTTADWVIVGDIDEFLYFPLGVEASFRIYDRDRLPFVRAVGWEMVSDVFPTTTGQIYDEVKYGAPSERWYSKTQILNPHLIKTISFEMGAHSCRANLKSGHLVHSPAVPSNPPVYLLHAKHLGSVEEIGAKYDAYRARFSELNIKNNWGCHTDGRKHAQEKRSQIMAHCQRVIV